MKSTIALLSAACILAGCGAPHTTSNLSQAQPNPSVVTSPTSSTASSSSSSSASSSSSSSSTSSTTTAAASASSNTPAPQYTAIQSKSGWTGCTATINGKPCASGYGDAQPSLTQFQTNPSLSGESTVFSIAGKTPYSNALWWNNVATDPKSTHFVYDLHFFLSATNAPQALEFDVNQATGGNRFVWGTECNFRGTGKWDLWDGQKGTWVPSQVPCNPVAANTWHQLTWQFERVGNQVHYISVTLDGKTSPVDVYHAYQANYAGDMINVAFQMDGNFQQQPFKVWLDDVSLAAW